MTKTKICGIQLPADALVAAAAGVDYIGLVFVPNRRRRLAVDAAAAIVSALRSNPQLAPQLDPPAELPTDRLAGPQSVRPAAPVRRPRVVGLFADQPLEEVNRVIQACGLDAVQLCGQESPEYCRQVQVQAFGQVSNRITGEAPGQVPGQVTGRGNQGAARARYGGGRSPRK
jgi:phosphoribosylanthranilate isomerase